jgi:hypothetical protein
VRRSCLLPNLCLLLNLHAGPCGGYLTPDRCPPALSHPPQVVRAYDRDGQIADGVLAGNGDHAMTVMG